LPAGEKQFYAKIFEMICEILNSYRDTYVNLHCVLTLSVFCKTLVKPGSTAYGSFIGGIRTLLNKLTTSLDDSASLFLGHTILNVLSHQIEDDIDLLHHCMIRIIKTELPSTIKSFSLPLCYVFSARQDILQKLIALLT